MRGAAAGLAAEGPWQFPAWALGLVGARTATSAVITDARTRELLGLDPGNTVPTLEERADLRHRLAVGRFIAVDTVMNIRASLPSSHCLSAEEFMGYLRTRLFERRGWMIFDGLVWAPDDRVEEPDWDEDDA